MIDQAGPPGAAQVRCRQTGDQRRVLRRNVALVVVAVQRPRLDLAARQLAAVHPLMERMVAVVALGPDGAQRGFQLVRRHRLVGPRLCTAHNTISIPSQATSQPARSTISRSGESSSRMGLLLLI